MPAQGPPLGLFPGQAYGSASLVLEPAIPDRTAMAAAQGAAAPITALRSAGGRDLCALFTELSASIERGLS